MPRHMNNIPEKSENFSLSIKRLFKSLDKSR